MVDLHEWRCKNIKLNSKKYLIRFLTCSIEHIKEIQLLKQKYIREFCFLHTAHVYKRTLVYKIYILM